MASVLEQIQGQQQREVDQGLSRAWHDNQWAEQFTSTPPAEKLRANLNLTDMVDKAVQLKQDLLAQTDLRAMALKAKTAEFDEWQKQAPLREQLLRARVDATGATERRKAEEAALEATQTANLNKGISTLYQNGLRKGSPEFIDAAAQLIADNPHADGGHVMEIGKLAGFGGDTPEEKLSQAVTMVREKEKARLALQPTLEQKVAEASQVTSAREKAKAEYRPEKDIVLPSLERERSLHAQALNRAKRIRSKAVDPNIIADADQDILDSQKALDDIESQIRTHRESSSKPAAIAQPEAALKLKPLEQDVATAARAAIAAGKDAEAVKKRLQESGYDPSEL